MSIWTIENGNQTADYNRESQTYTNRKQNVRVEGDSLVIHARAEEKNGKVYASREKTSNSVYDWPYDQPYYLILNLAIGGSWGGEKGIDDMSAEGWKLYVRSINYTPLQ